MIARLISCTPFETSPHSMLRHSRFGLLTLAVGSTRPRCSASIRLRGPAEAGHLLLHLRHYVCHGRYCSRRADRSPCCRARGDGRCPAVEVQNHQMVGLDDLANLFQLQIRDDAAARAVTASYKNQTIVLTPDQSLVSASGRLVSTAGPADATRQSLARACRVHQPRAGADLRCAARFPARLAPAGRRRSARPASHGAVRRQPVVAARDLRDHAARDATVTQEQNRLLAARRRRRARCLAAGRAVAAGPADRHPRDRPDHDSDGSGPAVQLVPHLASHSRADASAVVTVELLAAADSSRCAGAPLLAAAPGAPVPATRPLPVFGGGDPSNDPHHRHRPRTRRRRHRRQRTRRRGRKRCHARDRTPPEGHHRRASRHARAADARRQQQPHRRRRPRRDRQQQQGRFVHQPARQRIAEAGRPAAPRSLRSASIASAKTRGASRRPTAPCCRYLAADRAKCALVEWELAQAAHLDGSNAFAGIVDERLRATAGHADR